MNRTGLALLALGLLIAGCANQRKNQNASPQSPVISGSFGLGISSGGYGRNRHP